jgi:hypothetical protein
VSHPEDGKPDDSWRALDAPFTLRGEWDPIPGQCSRCGAQAWLGESKWWHANGQVCPSRRPVEFLPSP